MVWGCVRLWATAKQLSITGRRGRGKTQAAWGLPFPITFSQMAWFVACEFAVLALGELPPLSMIDGALLKYFGIPVGITWFMSQKTWDGKKPFSFVKSYTAYLLRPKQTFAGKPVKLKRVRVMPEITAVRSEVIHAVSD